MKGYHLSFGDLQTWQPIAVAVSHEFISPHKQPIEGDHLMDMPSSHSTHVARGQNAITDGNLPILTTDGLQEFRQMDEAWHNVYGVGLGIPPPPWAPQMETFHMTIPSSKI